MSAYREKPPPPRWRLVYRTPLAERLRQSAMLGGFGLLAAGSILGAAVGAILGGGLGLALAALGLMVFVTAGAFLGIHWATHLPFTAERTIAALRADERFPGRCRIATAEERWSLPVGEGALHEGQTIRVSYRDLSPDEDRETAREILEVRVAED
jgi:hypothetical protein